LTIKKRHWLRATTIQIRQSTFLIFGDFPVQDTCGDLKRGLNTASVALVANAINQQMLHLPSVAINLKIDGFQITNSFTLFDLAEIEQILKTIAFHRLFHIFSTLTLEPADGSLPAIKSTVHAATR
tara:strand:- start:561 stop:938 length:378 start_codon:yes stop_codon:yes gene_type:complete